MGTLLKFEFDFDEVFEGIKQGVIRELSETNFEEAKESAINSIKREVKTKIDLTYKDKNELKNEIKEKVFENLIKDVDEKYLEKFEVYVNEQLCKNPDRLEELKKDILEKTSNDLYTNLYDCIKSDVTRQIKDAVSQLCNVIGGNGIKIQDLNKTISKKEYEELLDRNRKLSALEAGGVDNWEWYSESLSQYYGDEE